MDRVLFTGFPGFLGAALLPLVLQRRPGARALCVVQNQFRLRADRHLNELRAAHPHIADRVELAEGDITEPGLGLPAAKTSDISEVFHLAAVYDLAVGEDLAHRVNVLGTQNVLDVCAAADLLERLHHVSTCYVSGLHPGVFTEQDLDTDQTFGNHYEQTKFLSEVLVREAMGAGLPVTTYRPGIVVGDSTTGETQKFDGPYFLIQFLMKQPGLAMVPKVTDPDRIRFSLVPRDFVVAAIEALSRLPEAVGKTYALTDPEPPTVHELVDTFCRLLDKEPVWVRVPLRLTRAIVGLPGVENLLGLPEESLAYFAHPTVYDTTNAQLDLAAAGIVCPRFEDYAPRMIEFVRTHPEVTAAAMA